MGSGPQYYDDDEPIFHRRYTGRGQGYAISHDRDLPHHGPYIGHRSHSHDGRNIPEPEPSTSNVRRRIPVACGRCRKRKIRCSGDPGNGGSCTNCKSAGNEQCRFLRVSSQEAPLKGEQADTIYDNSSAVTRPHRGVNIPSGQQYFAAPTPLGLDGYPYHRQNPVSSFGYPIKPYPFQHPYGEVTDEHIDYSSSPYQLMGSEQLGISPYACGSSSSSRNWSHAISVTPLPKDNTIYLEQDGLLNHPQYNPGTFPFRSASSPESKSLSLNSIATALPTTSADPDRVLPYPATGRQIHGPPLLRSSESHGSLHSHSQANRSMDGLPSYNCLMNTGMMGGSVKSLSDTTVAENASLAASYHTLPSTSESSQQTSDSYSTQERLYPVTNNSTEDLRYVTSQTTTNRRQSGPYSEINGTLSSPSTSVLSSGHEYVPLSRRAYYPTPPMAVPQMEIQSQSQSHQSHNQSVPTIPAA